MSTSTIKIPHENAFELKDKKAALETIAKLDSETLEKVAFLAKCPKKAKQKISKNWMMIKAMF